MILNIIVGYSNFVALLFARKINTWVLFSMFASFIYHLSETKHGLPGLSELNKYSSELLNIDRFFAVTSVIHVFSKLVRNPKRKNTFYFIGIIGVICLLYSEKDYFFAEISKIEYLITHCVWHFCAFYCLLEIMEE